MDRTGKADSPYQRLLAIRALEGDQEEGNGDSGGDDGAVLAVAQRGDVWCLGDHRLMCGDCTVSQDVHRLLDGATPHLMVTINLTGSTTTPNGGQMPLGLVRGRLR